MLHKALLVKRYRAADDVQLLQGAKMDGIWQRTQQLGPGEAHTLQLDLLIFTFGAYKYWAAATCIFEAEVQKRCRQRDSPVPRTLQCGRDIRCVPALFDCRLSTHPNTSCRSVLCLSSTTTVSKPHCLATHSRRSCNLERSRWPWS